MVDEPDGGVVLTIVGRHGSTYTIGSPSSATVTVMDNDPTVVSLTRVGTGAVSEGDKIEFTVTLGRALIAGEIIDVPLSIGGTGVTTGDWSLATKSGMSLNTGITLQDAGTSTPKVRFSGTGARTATLELTATADGTAEGGGSDSETFTIALGPDGTGTNGFDVTSLGTNVGGGADPHSTANTFNVTVNDPGTVPEITITAGTSPVTEGTAASFTVSANPAPSANLVVTVTVSENTSDGQDFVAASNEGSGKTLTISTSGSATYTVATVNDGVDEENGSVTVTVTGGSGYTLGSTVSASVTVNDDETPTITVTAGAAVMEGTAVSFGLTSTPALGSDAQVNYSVGHTPGSNFTPHVGGFEVFMGRFHTVRLSTYLDAVDEPDGGVTFTLTSGTGYMVGSPSSATVTVMDDDPTVVSLARVGAGAVSEGGKIEFTVTLGRALIAGEIIDVPLSISGTGVTTGDWSLAKKPGMSLNTGVTLRDTGTAAPKVRLSGAGAQTATLELTATADSTEEGSGSETFTIALGSNTDFDALTGTNVGGGADPHSTANTFNVTVNDPPTLSLTLGSTEDNEGHSGSRYVNVNLALSPTRSANTRFLLCVKNTGTATFRTGAKDFDLTNHNSNTGLTLDANNCHVYNIGPNSGSSTVSLRIFGDTVVEPDETAVLELRRHADTPSGVPISSTRGSATYTILNDEVPVVTVTGGADVTEGGNAVFTVSASPTPGGSLAVRLEVEDDATSDFLAPAQEGTKTVTIPSSGSSTYTVATVGDTTPEANGHVRVAVKGGTGYTVGSPGSASVAVNDDDGSTIKLSSAAYRVTEGGRVGITLNLTPASPVATTVAITYADGTASRRHTGYDSVRRTGLGKDYEAVPTEVVIPANATSHTFTVRTVDDAAVVRVEADETFTVALGALQAGFAKGTPSTATVTIEDNDTVPDPAPRVSSITRFVPSSETTSSDSLTWRMQFSEDVRNVDAADFRISGTTATLSVESAGILSAYRVKASGGDLAGLDGTVVLSFASGQNIQDTTGNALTDTTPTGANEDRFVVFNAAPPPTTPAVSITGGSAVTEGGNAVFTLSASPAPSGTITVSINVADSGDFAGSGQAGPRTVAMSGGSATLTVATVNDSVDETNGSLTATVGTGTGYSVGSPASASVAVNDDDDPPPNTPVVSISGGGAVTEGGNAVFTLSASPAPSGTITVSINVADSGDFAGSGQAGPRTVAMSGGSATLTVATVNDSVDETNGSLTATVGTGTGYSVGSPASASVAVNDDDGTSPPPPPPPAVPAASFETVTSRASEPTPAHRITVSLAPAPASAITLAYAVGGTAAAGDDYAALSGTLSVAAGASRATLEVEVLQDTEAEGDETILLTLADGSGYAPGGRRTHTLTIAGNDRAPQAQDSKVRVSSGRSYAFRLSDFRYTDADGDPLESMTVVSLPAQGELTLDGDAVSDGETVEREELERGELVYTPADDPEGPAAFTFRVNDGSADSAPAEMMLELVDRDAQRLAQGWLARFGRTAADQVIGAVEARLRAAPAPTGESAWQLRLAGRAWQAREASNRPDGLTPSEPETVPGTRALPDTSPQFSPNQTQGGLPPQHETASTGITRLSDLDWHGGTSFNYTARTGLGLGSLWGRGAVSQFDGREPDARLDARVASILLGADFVQDGRTFGLLLSHSRGKGGYRGDGDTGRFEAELTGAYPYARIEINERLSLWGVAGYGEGDLEQMEGEETSRTDLDSWMAAGGLRSRLKAGTAAWPELSAVADLLWVDTQADGTHDVASLDAEVSRLRIGLEGTWQGAELGSGHLRPHLRLSLRHDGGDAEHGFGTEVRAGADWTDARRGLTAQLQAHALLTHEEDGVQEKGFSGSLAWDPRPGSLRGATFSLSARSGAEPDRDGLLAADAFERDPARDTRQWQATLGYGVGAFGDRFTAVPQASVAWSEDAWDAGLGWRLAAEHFDLLLEARHRDASTDGSGFGLDLEMQGRW